MILGVVLTVMSMTAQAVPAFLMNCRSGSSVTGRFIYIGTYQYAGQQFERVFESWCPLTIEVY